MYTMGRLQRGTVCRAALGLRCSQGRHGRLVQLVSTLCGCALFGRERTLQRVRRLRSRACLHDWFECVEAIFGVRDMNVVGCIYVIAQMSFIAGASWPRSQAVPKQMGFQLGRLDMTEGVPNKTVAVLTQGSQMSSKRSFSPNWQAARKVQALSAFKTNFDGCTFVEVCSNRSVSKTPSCDPKVIARRSYS